MKKLFLFIFLAVGLISCNKEADRKESSLADGPVSFNITVAQTKAAKTDWAEGDKIYVFFYGLSYKYLILEMHNGHWTNTPGGGTITAADLAELTVNTLTAVHFPVAVDVAFSDGMFSFTSVDRPVYSYYLFEKYATYTVDGSVVTAALSLGKPAGMVQLHVAGIQASVTDYSFDCPKLKPVACTGVTTYGAVAEKVLQAGSSAGGVADSDGGIFSGRLVSPGASADYVFTVTGKGKDYKLTRTGKILTAGKMYNFPPLSKTGGTNWIVSKSTKQKGWFELPVMDTGDSNLYYASHSFTMNNKIYRNYTVCFGGKQHCPFWVAAPRHAVYESGSGRTNSYRADPDIPADLQYKSKDTGGGCNKGHMLGSAERTCIAECNQQVFYYSNIAPQLSSTFNTGGGAWNNLEDRVDTYVCSDTLYVVIGCYFDAYTDAYGETCSPKKISFGGRNDVAFPTMFYYALLRTKSGSSGKAVDKCSADELKCVAFVMRHNMEKGHKPQVKDMMSVSDLEKKTGFTYFTNVPNAPKDTFSPSDWGISTK